MSDQDADDADWEILPVLSLANGVLFPGMRCSVVLGTTRALGAVREATRDWTNKALAVCASRVGPARELQAKDLHRVGVLARIIGTRERRCCRRWSADLLVIGRVVTREFLQEDPFRLARVVRLTDPPEHKSALAGLVSVVRERATLLAECVSCCGRTGSALQRLREESNPARLAGIALELVNDIPASELQEALELPTVTARLEFALAHVHRRLNDVGADPGAGWRLH